MFFRSIAVLIFITALAVAEDPPVNAKQLEPLANQLVDALQREDIVAFSQCWLSAAQAQAFARQINKPEAIKAAEMLKPAFDERNRHVAVAYQRLVEELKKQGNLADLKLVRVELEGKIYEHEGIPRFQTMKIVLKLAETESVVDFEDGLEYQKQWFISGRAYNLESGRTKQNIYLQIPHKKK